MKYFSVDHMKFAFVDSRHNAFHWLVVVLIRIISFLILVPLSVYLAAFGFLLSAETIQPYLPPIWFGQVTFYSAQLPHLQQIKPFLFSQLNHWYKDAPTWWTMVVGMPLIVIGICTFLINCFNLYYSIFSSTYNRTHCPFCKEPIKAITG